MHPRFEKTVFWYDDSYSRKEDKKRVGSYDRFLEEMTFVKTPDGMNLLLRINPQLFPVKTFQVQKLNNNQWENVAEKKSAEEAHDFILNYLETICKENSYMCFDTMQEFEEWIK